jgi:hypothetical protein
LMVARWSVMFFTSFLGTPHFALNSRTTSTKCLVCSSNVCFGRLGQHHSSDRTITNVTPCWMSIAWRPYSLWTNCS